MCKVMCIFEKIEVIFCVNERGIKAYNNIGRNQNESEGIRRNQKRCLCLS